MGKEDLIYVPIEKLHTLKYVCGDHFHNSAFNKEKNRLKNCAIPSKNLKAAPLPDEMLLEFPCHIYSNIDVTTTNTPQGINDNEASLFQAGSSNSENQNPDHDSLLTRKRNHIDHTYCKTIKGLPTVTRSYVYQHDKKTNQRKEELVPTMDHPNNHNAELQVECDADAPHAALESSNINEREPDTIAEKEDTYSWEKRTGLVNIQDDPEQPENDFPDDVSLYCDDDDASLTDKENNHERLHNGFSCDNCRGDIIGFRYTCVQCSNYDLCTACETSGAHAQHYVLRVPGPKPYNEIQAVLTRIRKYLMRELDPISVAGLDTEDAISLKSEVKSESEDEDVEELEEVNPLEGDIVNHESIQDSRLSSPGSVSLENVNFEDAFLNDEPENYNTDFEQNEEQSSLMELSNIDESIAVSTGKRKSICNNDQLAKKTCITPGTNLHEVNNSTTIYTLEPDELNPIVKLFRLPSSIILQRGETVSLQSPSPSVQHIICIDGNR